MRTFETFREAREFASRYAQDNLASVRLVRNGNLWDVVLENRAESATRQASESGHNIRKDSEYWASLREDMESIRRRELAHTAYIEADKRRQADQLAREEAEHKAWLVKVDEMQKRVAQGLPTSASDQRLRLPCPQCHSTLCSCYAE